jgi:hypothetical protein
MQNIERIAENLRKGMYKNNPHACAEDRALLAGEYQFCAGIMEDILQRKPSLWNQLRIDVNSDTAAERKWEATDDGINAMGLKLRMKSLEKMMSGLKGLQDMAQGEMRAL